VSQWERVVDESAGDGPVRFASQADQRRRGGQELAAV
jgi:hypothetical protein